ncbi:hypothetical protein EG329_010624 [Mollisiaceae sp. DMI_Dod_QoI]|nr:hypothetical protein EG329_010624 [Helotiales sp. DMI_Dod_QoI]
MDYIREIKKNMRNLKIDELLEKFLQKMTYSFHECGMLIRRPYSEEPFPVFTDEPSLWMLITIACVDVLDTNFDQFLEDLFFGSGTILEREENLKNLKISKTFNAASVSKTVPDVIARSDSIDISAPARTPRPNASLTSGATLVIPPVTLIAGLPFAAISTPLTKKFNCKRTTFELGFTEMASSSARKTPRRAYNARDNSLVWNFEKCSCEISKKWKMKLLFMDEIDFWE